MANVAVFTFNEFQENTYLVYDDTNECIIFDPGCNTDKERAQLQGFISNKNLKPVRLINTHCHIDHVLGNDYIMQQYDLSLEIHKGEMVVWQYVPQLAQMYGVKYDASPEPSAFIEDNELLQFGNTEFTALFTPGHSPASLSFYFPENGFVIAGDVLFRESIGRTDLPGGDMDTLMTSIKNKLLSLPDKTVVWPGHGPETTIGHERKRNPFVLQNLK